MLLIRNEKMNVALISPIYTKHNNNIANGKTVALKQNSITSNYDLPKNSLSELAGRYQVSFAGTNKYSGSVFTHDCAELMGTKEHIEYNKENGSFVHSVTARDGSLKKREEFFPLEGKEIITRAIDDHTEVVTRVKGSGEKRELFDEYGRQVLLKVIDERNDTIKIIDTDYQRNRMVKTDIKAGEKNVSVFDLNTNQQVFTGDLVKDRKYDNKTGCFVTTNIITGQVLKIEKFSSNKKLIAMTEFFDGVDIPSRKITYDSRNDKYTDITYFETGAKKLYSVISKDGEEEFLVEFLKDGKTEKSRMRNYYDLKGNLTGQTIYIPGSSIISEYIDYGENDVTTYFYKDRPNVAMRAETRNGDRLISEAFYYEENGRMSSERIYNDDGSYSDICYTKQGINNQTYFFSPSGQLLSAIEFDQITGKKICYVEVNPVSKEIKETQYDKNTGNVSKVTFFSKNKKVKEVILFYPDGNTPRIRKEYHKDGSYTATKYDEFGNILKRGVFNADGTPKAEGPKRQQSVREEEAQLTDKDFLNKISGIVSQLTGNFRLSDEQFARLSEIIGVNDFEMVKHMDKATYRNLAKKYRETDKLVFSIINNIYHSPNNDKQGS